MKQTGEVRDILFQQALKGNLVCTIWFADVTKKRVETWGNLAEWAVKNINEGDTIIVNGYEKVMKYKRNGEMTATSTLVAVRIDKENKKQTGKEKEI